MLNIKNKNKFYSKHFLLIFEIKFYFLFIISIKKKYFYNTRIKNLTKKIFIFFVKKIKFFKFLKIKIFQIKKFNNKKIKNFKNIYFEIIFLFKKLFFLIN